MKKLFFIISATFLPFSSHAWEPCGIDAYGHTANCEYQIDASGTLTIRGVGNNGNIGHWYSNEQSDFVQPWKGKNVKNIVIEDSIKDLGGQAFYNIKSENPIKIPSSVTSVSAYAFDGVETPEVIIPDSVEIIGDSSFKSESLQKITIPDSVKIIEGSAFRWSTNLTDIVFPENLESIGDLALSYCLNLKTITIGENTNLGALFEGYDYDQDATDIANLKIYCTGDTAKCDAHLAAAGYPDLKSSKATTKQINGVTYVYDKSGKLVTSSGHRTEKRIYTIEEANAIAGTKNRISIKYR